MKLSDVNGAIDEALLDLLKNEIASVYKSVEPDADQRQQISAGFDGLIAYEALVKSIAAQKFKD